MRVLVVGGTGPSGPHVLDGLLARGHDVTIFHRGTHEPAGLPDVEHIHAELEVVAIPADVAVEAATTLLPLAGTTATHSVLSTEKARRQLGWGSAVSPMDALRGLVESYRERPDFDPSDSPSFTDRFDYATEDALIDAWRHARRDIETAVRQRQAPPVHSMPHPREPGSHDHRGR